MKISSYFWHICQLTFTLLPNRNGEYQITDGYHLHRIQFVVYMSSFLYQNDELKSIFRYDYIEYHDKLQYKTVVAISSML